MGTDNQGRDSNRSNQQQGAGEAGRRDQPGGGQQSNRQQGGFSGGNRQQEQQGGRSGDRGQFAKEDGITQDDIDAGNDSSQSGQIGNQDRERSGSTRSRKP
jgi:hypothetical protein